jgi:glycerol-3-phosphate dehydrogenase
MAEEAVDIIVRRLGKSARPCETDVTPIEESDSDVDGRPVEDHLRHRYGPAAKHVLDLLKNDDSLNSEIVPGLPYKYAELDYCIEQEMVITLEDFLWRRVPLLLEDKNHGLNAIEQVAGRIQSALGWSNELREQQVDAYREVVRKSLPHSG